MRQQKGVQGNTEEIIEIAYDLQTGSYVAAMEDTIKAKHQREYTAEIARIILSLYKRV